MLNHGCGAARERKTNLSVCSVVSLLWLGRTGGRVSIRAIRGDP